MTEKYIGERKGEEEEEAKAETWRRPGQRRQEGRGEKIITEEKMLNT